MSDVIGMFGAITGGTEDAIAVIDVPQDGFLIGIDWDVNALFDAAESLIIELSFIATNQLTTNDVRSRISSVSAFNNVITAVGVSAASIQKWLGAFDIVISGGERIYLHSIATAGVAAAVRCNLYVELGTVTRRPARRR